MFIFFFFFILMKKSTLEFYPSILDTHCILSTQNEKKNCNLDRLYQVAQFSQLAFGRLLFMYIRSKVHGRTANAVLGDAAQRLYKAVLFYFQNIVSFHGKRVDAIQLCLYKKCAALPAEIVTKFKKFSTILCADILHRILPKSKNKCENRLKIFQT